MTQRNTNLDTHALELVNLISKRETPITAVEIAFALNIEGNREGQRRRVRQLAKHARDQLHAHICANHTDGYWIARNDNEWRNYLDAKRKSATFMFIEIAKQQQAAKEVTKAQNNLFGTPNTKEAAWANI